MVKVKVAFYWYFSHQWLYLRIYDYVTTKSIFINDKFFHTINFAFLSGLQRCKCVHLKMLHWSLMREVSIKMMQLRNTDYMMCQLFPGRTDINLSKAPHFALGLTAAIREQTTLSGNKRSSRLSTMHDPATASWITTDWQMTLGFPAASLALQKPHTHWNHTENHKGIGWQVQLTSRCFHQQLCPTSPLQPETAWVTKWQQTSNAFSCLCLSACFTAVTPLCVVAGGK